jgi:transposase
MDLLAELTQQDLPQALLDSVRLLLEQADKSAQIIAHKDHVIKVADIKTAALALELAHHKRIRFANKSEAFTPTQNDLFEETWNTDLAAMEAEVEQQRLLLAAEASTSTIKPKRLRAGRQPLPAHLPRIEHRHEPESCHCGQCGLGLIKIGEDISEQLDVEPARFFVHRHIRPQYACRACERIAAAPIPPAIIDGGMAAPGLLAWVAVSKFADHLPLYRIEQIGARQQVPLPRSTLADWVGKVGVALQPLADRLAELLRQQACLHADETPVQQLDPGRGKTKRAYLWAYRSNSLEAAPLMVVFDYQPGRAGAHAQTFLQDWQGHLMVDDYAGYKALFGNGITELACMAHVRRKFFELHVANGSAIAAEALGRIGALYVIERQAQDFDIEARLAYRQTQAKPLLAQWQTWLILTRKTTADGSGTAKALDHAIKRCPALMRYAESGSLPIDNNPVENAIRPIAIGKKNWLFAGSERAGRRAAAIQSLLATARLNGIEPLQWLKDTLEKLPTWPNSQIDALLPLPRIS